MTNMCLDFFSSYPITVVVIVIANIVLTRMAGHHISLLHIVRLNDTLQATVNSSELKEFKVFENIAHAVLQEEFWKYLFVMCCALYAPMRLIHLSDKKTTSMDKL